jgi:putative restriction endonuclease
MPDKRTTSRRPWERDELLLALSLYFQTRFGRLHRTNPDIVELATTLGRTPSAVAMKASNFASLDPRLAARGVVGLQGASRADRAIWAEARPNMTWLAVESELAQARITRLNDQQKPRSTPTGPTETQVVRNERRVQSFFRAAVLATYDDKCAVTGMSVPALLNASHIIPWSIDEERRADPSNGIALNVLHDRAFDRGFITFDQSLKLIVSSALRNSSATNFQQSSLLDYEGSQLSIPDRNPPDEEALRYHRETVFIE